MEWVTAHWEYFLAGFYLADKVVKLTPTDKDDLVVDVIAKTIFKLFKKK